MRYLTAQEIIAWNRTIILRTGGFTRGAGRLANASSLEYLIEVVKSHINETEIYSTLITKAAAYAYNIITRHIFLDGNKRTGMNCAFIFLYLNGCPQVNTIADDEIFNIALKIATGKSSRDELVTWFQKRIIQI